MTICGMVNHLIVMKRELLRYFSQRKQKKVCKSCLLTFPRALRKHGNCHEREDWVKMICMSQMIIQLQGFQSINATRILENKCKIKIIILSRISIHRRIKGKNIMREMFLNKVLKAEQNQASYYLATYCKAEKLPNLNFFSV